MKIKIDYELEIPEENLRDEAIFHDREYTLEAIEEDIFPAIRDVIGNITTFNEIGYKIYENK